MQPRSSLQLGILLIIAGLLGAALLVSEPVVLAHEPQDGERSDLHEQMHRMMDEILGHGFSERMHQEMPGSEEMMEACSQMMEEHGMSGMGSMMNGMDSMDGMMPGMSGMMRDD